MNFVFSVSEHLPEHWKALKDLGWMIFTDEESAMELTIMSSFLQAFLLSAIFVRVMSRLLRSPEGPLISTSGAK